MRPIFFLILLLLLNSCVSSYNRFDKNYKTFAPYFEAIDNYPHKDSIQKTQNNVRIASQSGNDIEMKKAKNEQMQFNSSLSQYLNKTVKPFAIPFSQKNKSFIEITSVTTSLCSYLKLTENVSVEVIIKYKPLTKIRKFDFVQMECNDENNFCIAIFFPELSDSGETKISLPLSKEYTKFSTIIFD